MNLALEINGDSNIQHAIAIVIHPNKCLKFMTFQGDVLKYSIECKYLILILLFVTISFTKDR